MPELEVKSYPKSQFASLLDCSLSTLLRRVELAMNSPKANFTFTLEEYKRARVLPPVWVAQIAKYQGYID